MEAINKREDVLNRMEDEMHKSHLALLAKSPNQLICDLTEFSEDVQLEIKKSVPFCTDFEKFLSICGELVSIEKEKKLLYRSDIAVSRANTKLEQIISTISRLVKQVEALDARSLALVETNTLVARSSAVKKSSSTITNSLLDEAYFLSVGAELSKGDNTGEHVAKPLNFIVDIYSYWLQFGGEEIENNDRGKFFTLVKILLSEINLDNDCPSHLISKAIFGK
jgi:hypothetical protein